MMPGRPDGGEAAATHVSIDHRVARLSAAPTARRAISKPGLADRRIALVEAQRPPARVDVANVVDVLLRMDKAEPFFIRLAPGSGQLKKPRAADRRERQNQDGVGGNGLGESISPANRTARAMARIRSGRSGWCGPVRWSTKWEVEIKPVMPVILPQD